jgi:tryptophan synthase alpha chain
MSRIAQCFSNLAQQQRRAVIPYIVAGDPLLDITVELMHQLVDAGADIIELGVPFSDPMAEGPVIALGHERALEKGVSLRVALGMVEEFRQRDGDTPVLLMGYANPLQRMGYGEVVEHCVDAGVDALLTVDLPPEEVEELGGLLLGAEMDNILLVAPTTAPQRVQKIAERASGFVYYVSLKGVTGAGNLDTDVVGKGVAEIRKHTNLPVSVGFGIKDAESAAAIAAVADGVVVGSALVKLLSETAADGGNRQDIMSAGAALVTEIRQAVDAVNIPLGRTG